VGAERYQLLAGVRGYGRRGRKLRGLETLIWTD
jgi:hypothetical protein